MRGHPFEGELAMAQAFLIFYSGRMASAV